MILRARQHVLEFPRQPLLIGSVRLCFADAFGRNNNTVSRALAAARRVASEGADIVALDLEGCSPETVDGDQNSAIEICSAFVSAWNEISAPQLLALQNTPLQVARAVLPLGGDLLMDAPPIRHNEARRYAALCAEYGAGFIAQYTPQSGLELSLDSCNAHVLVEAEKYFEEILRGAKASGLSDVFVALGVCLNWTDAASTEASLRLSSQMGRFQHFGRPVMLSDFPAGKAPDHADTNHSERQTAGMVARVVHGLLGGVQLFHTQEVLAAGAAVRTLSAVLQ
jgi:dihydropteroate synthase